MSTSVNIIAGIAGSIAAVLQLMLIRNPIKNLLITGFVASTVGSYHFYIQPVFNTMPLPLWFLAFVGVYFATKGILSGLRLFGIIAI